MCHNKYCSLCFCVNYTNPGSSARTDGTWNCGTWNSQSNGRNQKHSWKSWFWKLILSDYEYWYDSMMEFMGFDVIETWNHNCCWQNAKIGEISIQYKQNCNEICTVSLYSFHLQKHNDSLFTAKISHLYILSNFIYFPSMHGTKRVF